MIVKYKVEIMIAVDKKEIYSKQHRVVYNFKLCVFSD